MASETDIANLALGRLGIGQAIASLNELSQPAKICRRFFEHCRQSVLRAHPWGFASVAVSIAQIADETYPGWQYVYQYPDDALMVWSVADEGGIRSWPSMYFACWRGSAYRDQYDIFMRRYPFQKILAGDGSQPALVSDVPSAWAYFTKDVTNTGAYPVDFIDALAWRLAAEVAGPLKVSADLRNNALQQFIFWNSHATAQDMNERGDDIVPDSESITCRL